MSEPLDLPTREGYDLWSQIYDDEDNPLIALETAWITRLLGDVRGLAIADVGCGTGRHALAMAAAGARVFGLDFSPGMLAKARAKPGAGAVRLVQHDLTTGLPFASGSVDRVTCCLVLEHVAEPGERIRRDVADLSGRRLRSRLRPPSGDATPGNTGSIHRPGDGPQDPARGRATPALRPT